MSSSRDCYQPSPADWNLECDGAPVTQLPGMLLGKSDRDRKSWEHVLITYKWHGGDFPECFPTSPSCSQTVFQFAVKLFPCPRKWCHGSFTEGGSASPFSSPSLTSSTSFSGRSEDANLTIIEINKKASATGCHWLTTGICLVPHPRAGEKLACLV